MPAAGSGTAARVAWRQRYRQPGPGATFAPVNSPVDGPPGARPRVQTVRASAPFVALLLLALALVACPSGDAGDASVAPGDAPPGMVWIPGGTFAMGDDGPFALPH